MNKGLILLAVSSLSLSVWADNEPGMLVRKTDGSQLELTIANIRSIKFGNGQMMIHAIDNTQQTVPLDDVAEISFCTITAAIRALTPDAPHQAIILLDLAGNVLYQGPADSADIPTTLRGTYIVVAHGQSHKVTIQ